MKFRKLLSLGYVLVFALVIVLASVTYWGVSSLRKTADNVAITQKVISDVNLLEKIILHMETGVRGYLVIGNQKALEPYRQGDKDFHKTLHALKNLVSHNKQQLELLNEIDELEEKWHEVVAGPQIKSRDLINANKKTIPEVAAELEKGVGEEIMGEIHQKFDEFVKMEKDLLDERERDAKDVAVQSVYIVILGTLLTIVIGIAAMLIVSRSIFKQVGGEPAEIAEITGRIAKGELDIHMDDRGLLSGIYASVKTMLQSLRANKKAFEEQDWLKSGVAKLNDVVRGEQDLNKLGRNIVTEIASYINAQIGALYLLDESDKENTKLVLSGTYAYKKRKNLSNEFKVGEGLVGQACLEKQQIMLKNVPEDYIKITSALGEAVPEYIVETPFMFEGKVIGVIEIGSLHEITDLQLKYLEQALNVAGVSFNIVQRRQDLEHALRESQELSEELQAQSEELQAQQEELQAANEELQSQQEELKTANEELEEQTMALKQNEKSLMSQQDKLKAANDELEEKTDFLEKQRAEIIEKNDVLAKTGAELEAKAKELEISSRYKSEFLANMSHELRTPLNSILLLSKDLAQNKDKHLDEEELESAEIVYNSGKDLLNLIDDILNLSKIEAGKMTVNLEKLSLKEFQKGIKQHFTRLVKEKGLKLNVNLDTELPDFVETDAQKLDQIIKNLISNACKFTETGSIDVSIYRPPAETDLRKSGLAPKKSLAISVIDSGIGIPEDKQQEIFEAFQQADGSTSRKYGGTGLGLSISRELARLLGGEISLQSTVGKGSTFTLYIPENSPEYINDPDPELKKAIVKNDLHITHEEDSAEKLQAVVSVDKDIKSEDGDTILIVEDDPVFTKVLVKQCRENGFECLTAQDGVEALKVASEKIPKAIILDIRLPEKSGWEVLDELKKNSKTKNIPVHVMSGDDKLENALSKGVVGTLRKPISKEDLTEALNRIKNFVDSKKKTLLIVEDNADQVKAIKKLIAREDLEIFAAGSGKEAINILKSQNVDCMVLDLTLPDISGFTLLDKLYDMEDITTPPVVVYTGKELSKAELAKLEEHSETVIIKGAKSAERLLDETALFLNQVVKPKNSMLVNLHDKDEMFKDKKVLVVDDDMRNVFALSKILKQKGIVVVKAENGKKALKQLEDNEDIDLVLMDIMMPEMNGYETIQRIRDPHSGVKNHEILIFALTAKAMKKDREKCIEAGANDYLSKPVDIEKLFSMMRVWLYK
jgi:CheY-like chemotaxis protein/signal transduction histidine kinase/CHASE3 domain sensor protein